MNVFEAVKEQVSTRQAAAFYGIAVGRNGMALCPFHSEKHPSMKIDRRFHCFGCQADGDVIDFTARLYGMSPKSAAEKLASDFGICYDSRRLSPPQPRKAQWLEELRASLAEDRCFHALSNYRHLLVKWRTDYAPQPTDTQWHPLFVESLQKLEAAENVLDTLLSGSPEDKAAIIIEHGKEVEALEQRLSAFAIGNEASLEKRNRSHGTELER